MAVFRIWTPVCEMQMEARDDGASRLGNGNGAAGGAAIRDGTSISIRMGVGRRATSDAVTVSVFMSISRTKLLAMTTVFSCGRNRQ